MSEPLASLRAMIVDDHPHMRRLIRAILAGFGLRDVIFAESGAKALEILRTDAPDFIVTDMEMLPVSGLDFVRELRRLPYASARRTPVIVLTAHGDEHTVRKARDAGADEFLVKPVCAEAVWRRIASIVERPRAFIESTEYIGPDRRRSRRARDEHTPRRRWDDVDDADMFDLG